MKIKIQNFIDDAKCYETIRNLRWSKQVYCPHCRSDNVIKRGKDDSGINKQRYELGLNKDDAQYMAQVLRSGVVEKKPEVLLSQEVEYDEVYVVAGHKGNPAAVKKESIRAAKSLKGCQKVVER